MPLMLDSFFRAIAYCLHPRVIVLTFLPLVLMVGITIALGQLFWNDALVQLRDWLDAHAFTSTLSAWLEGWGGKGLNAALAPLLIIFAVTPIIVVLSLLVVAFLMVPAIVRLVAEKRFPALVRHRGASFLSSVVWALGSTIAACAALLVSIPLWAIPPLVLVLPPLIWGWLTYRVMAFDALAEHASEQERRTILRDKRLPLFAMGVVTGCLGAVPSLVWASGAMLAAAFFLLVPLAIWLYTLVFAFASLWYAHYCLAALHHLRASHAPAVLAGVSA